MTTTEQTAQGFFRYCRDNGVQVWIAYGQTEITGWVLSVTKHYVEVQDSTCGHVQRVALAAIEESVEA